MKIDKSKIKRILVITLSNVGDILLTTPVIGELTARFPKARLDVIVGPNGREIFEKDPAVSKVIIYDKHTSVMDKRRLVSKLRRLKYDLVVDLRNTIFGVLLGPRYRTSPLQKRLRGARHKKEEHLFRLKGLGIEPAGDALRIHITAEDEEAVERLIRLEGLKGSFVVVSAGAKSHLKRWPEEHFAKLCDRIVSEMGMDVVFIGLTEDGEVVDRIIGKMKARQVNLVNKTGIRALAALMRRSRLVITNDSAPLHLACAAGSKVLALFGPTDPARYGPTGKSDIALHKKLACAPCESAVCGYDYECMRSITSDEVFEAAAKILKS